MKTASKIGESDAPKMRQTRIAIHHIDRNDVISYAMVYKTGGLHKDTRCHYQIMLLVGIHGHNGGIHIGPLTRLDLNKNHLIAFHPYDIDLEMAHPPIARKYCIPLGYEVLSGILLAHTAQFAAA